MKGSPLLLVSLPDASALAGRLATLLRCEHSTHALHRIGQGTRRRTHDACRNEQRQRHDALIGLPAFHPVARDIPGQDLDALSQRVDAHHHPARLKALAQRLREPAGEPTVTLGPGEQRVAFDMFDPTVLELRELYGSAPSLRQRIHLGAEWSRLCYALEMGALLEDLAHTIHVHPTMSETLPEAALGALGHAIHI